MLHRRSIVIFLLIAFIGAWILFLLPLAFGAPGSTERLAATQVAWSAAMWAPGVAALIATRKVDGNPIKTLGLGRLGEKRMYLAAWLTPPVLIILAGLLTALLGIGKPDLEFSQLREAMEGAGASVVLSPGLVVLIQAAAGLTIGPLFNTLFAMGEELGWRGYLLPKLLPLGQMRAILFSGLIWGIWHWPVILQGHNYPGQPIPGLFLMVGFTVLFGAFLSWLYLRTRSPWAPALGHASLNAFAGMPLLFMPGVNMALGGTLTSLIGWIPMALLIAVLVWRGRLPVADSPEPGEMAEFVQTPTD